MTRLTTKARQVYELSGVFIALFWFLCVFVFGLLLDPGRPLKCPENACALHYVWRDKRRRSPSGPQRGLNRLFSLILANDRGSGFMSSPVQVDKPCAVLTKTELFSFFMFFGERTWSLHQVLGDKPCRLPDKSKKSFHNEAVYSVDGP